MKLPRLTCAATVAALAASGLTATTVTSAAAAPTSAVAAADTDPVSLVNTFIGSQDDGNTFPGASAPFGMMQASPVGTHYSGWRYTDTRIKGFGHNFLSGAGCWEQGGQLSVLPTTGSVGPGAAFDTAKAATFDHTAYAAAYTHDGEVGEAGYYRTRLTSYGGITAETTADTRATVERYTFSSTADANVFVNTGQATDRHKVTASQARIVDDRTITGEVRTQSFCGGREYSTWFTMTFDRPFRTSGTWSPTGGTVGGTDSGRGGGLRGAWVSFDATSDRDVEVTTSISKVDPRGARTNFEAEGLTADGSLRGFDAVRAATQDAWRTELNRLRTAGGTRDDQVVFTSSLYRSLLQPLTGNDADGRYRGYDDRIHTADGWTYYEYFSLWDTYRAQNQLLAILRPTVARDVARSVLTIQEQGGWLPRWGYANYETNVMTGDPVTPFLVDLWRYGALSGREAQAYAALKQNADGIPPADSPFSGRAGNARYLEDGFVQHDPGFPKKGMDVDPAHGASATLESALADCSLSIMARALGKAADAERYAKRGGNWSSIWDAAASSEGFTGFPRPRRDDGSWFDAVADPTSDTGFHEGTGWQYQWLTQQDVPGVMKAMGGREAMLERLDHFFDMPTLLDNPSKAARESWVIGPYSYYNVFRYNPNNEPDLHSGSLYSYLGEPAKTSAVFRAAKTLFTNRPNGVTGNDDLGTMSAWYVFTAIGLYPGMPGTGQLIVTAPQFERIELTPEGGRTVTITARGANASALQYVSSVRVGQANRAQTWINWDQLRSGRTIDISLTSDRSGTTWGTKGAVPASPCAGQAGLQSVSTLAPRDVRAGGSARVTTTLTNFGADPRNLTVAVDAGEPVTATPASRTVTLAAGESRQLTTTLTVPQTAPEGSVPVAVTTTADGATVAEQQLALRVRPPLAAGSLLGSVTKVTASNEFSAAGEVAANLADADPATKWLALVPTAWAQYELSSAQMAARYTLTSANDSPTRDPRDFRLLGSNDGQTWTTLDSRNGVTFTERLTTRSFDVATPGSYRFYRLDVTANGGDSLLQLADWEPFGP